MITSIITPIIIPRVIISGAPRPVISSVISVFIAVPTSSEVVIPTVPTTKCSSATAYPGIIACKHIPNCDHHTGGEKARKEFLKESNLT